MYWFLVVLRPMGPLNLLFLSLLFLFGRFVPILIAVWIVTEGCQVFSLLLAIFSLVDVVVVQAKAFSVFVGNFQISLVFTAFTLLRAVDLRIVSPWVAWLVLTKSRRIVLVYRCLISLDLAFSVAEAI